MHFPCKEAGGPLGEQLKVWWALYFIVWENVKKLHVYEM